MTIDHTQHPPEKWQEILQLALTDLRINPRDSEALQAIRDANEALNAYEQPAIQAGENVGSTGFGHPGAAIKGLAQGVWDIPSGLATLAGQLVTNPSQIIPDMVETFRPGGGLDQRLESGDPQQIARGVVNTGSLLLPFAKTSGAAGAASVGARAGEVAVRPFRAVGEVLERQGLKNKLIREQTEGNRLSNETMRANLNKPPARVAGLAEEQLAARQLMNERLRAQATEPPVRVEGMAQEQLIGRQLQNELLKQRLEAAGETVPIEPPIPMSPVAPVAPKPIPEPMPGTPGGYMVEGPPTPPVRTEPTLIEMQQGFKEPPIPRKGQKALEFSPKGQKTAYSTETQTEFKTLLGELARSLRGK